jgi:hypothetical protein
VMEEIDEEIRQHGLHPGHRDEGIDFGFRM